MHQGADAVVGQQFQQHCMRNFAVHDDDALDSLIKRVNAGLDLWDHASGNRAVGDQLSCVGDGELRNQIFRFVEYAGHIREQQEAFGL